MERSEIQRWLLEENPHKLKKLWNIANTVRKENVGDAVYLRGLLEISNYCTRNCSYCGINFCKKKLYPSN